MTLHPRPCTYGKRGGDAHDEEELYFHCELSEPGPGHSGHYPTSPLNPLPCCHCVTPTPPATEAPFLGFISFSPFPVKVPTRRTFVDPQSCGDPLQAVHLFAKELDEKSVILEKSLGAGKPGGQEAFVHRGAPAPP